MYADIQRAIASQMEAADLLWKAMLPHKPCKHCGGPLKQHATERTQFCSIACAAQYQHVETCRVCGVRHSRVGVQGRKGSMCKKCKRKAHNKQRTHSKGIAERAKKYGVLRVKYCRNEIFARDQWKCQLCGSCLRRKWTYNRKTLVPHPRNATIDHILPMSKGGDDAEWNVQACCLVCNGKKSARTKGQTRLKFL
jgi:5-methylcytosine-specific restriction endonuclease McrA